MDGGYYFQSDARNNLPNISWNKPSLLCSDVCLPKSDSSSGNIISVAVCCILLPNTYGANGDETKDRLSGSCASYLAISVHAVIIIVRQELLRGITIRVSVGNATYILMISSALWNMRQGESISRHFYNRVEECEYFHSCSKYSINSVVRYSEIVDIMFQNNTFHFHGWQTIIDFSHTLLPHRLSMIRILQLSFPYLDLTGWNTCCQILATKLPGLKTLTIRLLAPYRKRLVDCLMPLYQIQQPAVFTVVVTILGPDPQWEVLTRFVDAPFRIELVERDSHRKAHCYTPPI
mgnify:CR=1 FL=1